MRRREGLLCQAAQKKQTVPNRAKRSNKNLFNPTVSCSLASPSRKMKSDLPHLRIHSHSKATMADNFFGFTPESFEQFARALAVAVLGPNVIGFGDGPDGGRKRAIGYTIGRYGDMRGAAGACALG